MVKNNHHKLIPVAKTWWLTLLDNLHGMIGLCYVIKTVWVTCSSQTCVVSTWL